MNKFSSKPETPPHHWMAAQRHLPTSTSQWAGSLLLLGFGFVLLYFLAPPIMMNLRATRWNLYRCTIIESRVAAKESTDTEESRTLYRPELSYWYELAGKRYESSRYRFANPYINDQSVAEGVVARHPQAPWWNAS